MASLEELLGALQEARAMEAMAKDDRIALEEAIVAQIEDAPANGSMTLKAGSMKCAVKFGLSYKANVDQIRELGLPDEVLPLKLVPSSYKLDEKAYEALRKEHPGAFAKVAACVTTTPKKPGLTLKV